MQEAGASTRAGQPRVLIYTAALVSGLFLALSVHIWLAAAGIGLAGGREVFLSGKGQINLAMAWWAIGIAGCFGSLLAIVVARRLNRPGFRFVRLLLAVIFFGLLAVAGRKAAALPGGGAAMTTAVNLAAITLGGFMAFFAAHFAARR